MASDGLGAGVKGEARSTARVELAEWWEVEERAELGSRARVALNGAERFVIVPN